DFAVKVFAADDVRCQLAPERWHFAVCLLEDQFAVFAFDLSATNFPVDGGEKVFDIGWAELSIDLESAVETLGTSVKPVGRIHGRSVNGGHRGILPRTKVNGHPTNVNVCTHAIRSADRIE